MSTKLNMNVRLAPLPLTAAFFGLGFATAGSLPAAAAETETPVVVIARATADKTVEAEASAPGKEEKRKIIITAIEPSGTDRKSARREVAWLGVASEETSDALASQLGLNSGEGLLVTFVAAESPAAKAGLQKNDVLVELNGQMLVHPAQFRKLVQMRKEGDTVKLTFYRAGKKEDASVKLGKTTLGLLGDERSWQGDLGELKRQLQELPLGEKFRDEMNHLRESLAQSGIDKENIRIEVKRSMEDVRRAVQEALRQATNAHRTLGPAWRELRELSRRGVDVDKDATVVVKSHRNAVKTMVKTDDTGTYVLVADPKKRLTAHDKEGNLTFDGQIDTEEQQQKVPKEVWEKAKPMLEQLNSDKGEPRDADEEAEKDGI